MARYLEFVVNGPPISNQQSTPQGRANLNAWRATIGGAATLVWPNSPLTIELKVVLHPKPDDLPLFAKDFKVQILARKDNGGILTVAKDSPSELQADQDVARYLEIVAKQPGWRLDVFVLGPEVPAAPVRNDVRE